MNTSSNSSISDRQIQKIGLGAFTYYILLVCNSTLDSWDNGYVLESLEQVNDMLALKDWPLWTMAYRHLLSSFSVIHNSLINWFLHRLQISDFIQNKFNEWRPLEHPRATSALCENSDIIMKSLERYMIGSLFRSVLFNFPML